MKNKKHNTKTSPPKSRFNSLEIALLVAIIVISILISFILSLGPMNYHGELGWRTIHSRMIARELDRNNFNFLETEVYCRGTKLPYAQGFPINNMVVASFYKIFGEHQIIGRLVSTVSFGIALVLFYLFSLHFLSRRWAVFAVFLFSFNYIGLSYSNQFQSTSFEIMLILLILVYLQKYLATDNIKYFSFWSSLFILLCLTKITYGLFLFIPIIIKLYSKYKLMIFTRLRYNIFFGILLLSNLSWYLFAMSKTHSIYRQSFITYFTDIYTWIFVENRLTYVINLFKRSGNLFISSVSILGLMLLLIGFIKLIKLKKFFLPVMTVSFVVLWGLIPYKFLVHPYNFMILLIPSSVLIATGLEMIFKIKSSILITLSVERENKTTEIRLNPVRQIQFGFLFLFICFYALSNFISFTDMHKYNYDYMRHICKRVNELTNSSDKVIFANQYLGTKNIWQNEYSYESDRLGWPLAFPYAFSPSKVVYFLNKGATNLAISNTASQYPYEMMEDFHKRTYNWLYGTFPLVESYYDYYQLFDLSLMNKFELESEVGLRCMINYNDKIELVKVRGNFNKEKNRIEIKFLWKCLSRMPNRSYDLLPLTEDHYLEELSHQILGKQYDTSMWYEKRKYSEWIYIDKDFDHDREWSFIPVLYDPIKRDILLPSTLDNSTPKLVITLSSGNVTFKLEEASELEKSALNKENIHRKGRAFFLKELKDNLKHQELNLAKTYP